MNKFKEFTFHYASTLSARGFSHWTMFFVFTFHYASTLSAVAALVICLADCIYIPLCFYFITLEELNSNKISGIYIPLCFYFIFTRRCAIFTRSNIYIPLCFYFIQDPFNSLLGHFRIYIPLCFYFISLAILFTAVMISFTFHYASTLSIERGAFARYLARFTFHYASTLSCLGGAGKPLAIIIYIPLCFYFILISR